jgi:small-conductance mechanosensitive channel
MDTATIDQEFEKLQGEFDDVAKTVQALAQKLQAAEQAGDKNATEWLGDLKQVAQDIDDEQTQAKVVLLALHSFIAGVAQGQEQPAPQPASAPQPGMTMGGGMFGGYMGGSFARSMEMGAAMGLGSSLISSIFR